MFQVHYRIDGVRHMHILNRVPQIHETFTYVDDKLIKHKYNVIAVEIRIHHPNNKAALEEYHLQLTHA